MFYWSLQIYHHVRWLLSRHIKTGHKEIYDQIQKVIDPLVKLMESNQRLLSFEISYWTLEQKEKVVFKETILLK